MFRWLSSKVKRLCSEAHHILIVQTRISSLNQRATDLHARYNQLGELGDLNDAISLGREALSLCPHEHPHRSTSLNTLARCLSARYHQLKGIDDLEEAIFLTREALSLRPSGHPDRSTALMNLADDLFFRYEQLGGMDDLHEAIILTREALSLRPPGHPDRSMSLTHLAHHLSSQYKQMGSIDDLNEAIVLDREALSLCPLGHPDRSMSLNNLANYLSSRYAQLGDIDDLKEAIVLNREVLLLEPLGSPARPVPLNNLADCLSSRYNLLGGIDDLNEAIILAGEALSLCPLGHYDRAMSLSNLAGYLSSRFTQLGGIDDLNKAVVLTREALSLCPLGHFLRPTSLNNLARHLIYRYNQLGGIDDLNEAIVLARETLSLSLPGYPNRSMPLNNLAGYLSSRYEWMGGIDDLNEAIILAREALALRPLGHPNRSMSLNNLGSHLSSRYKQMGEINDINEAIILSREALSLCPPGHADHSISLSNLASFLFARYGQLEGIDDINEAIVLDREALSLCPLGHFHRPTSLNNLATHLASRYNQLGSVNDLDEAIVLGWDALSFRPSGHPDRSMSLNNLALLLSFRYNLKNSTKDKQDLFTLYTELKLVSRVVSSSDLSAAKAWINAAENFTHPTTLLAYETSLRLLVQHVAALPSLPRHLDLLKSLSSSLAVDAFSACLRNHSPAKAVELLEQGRAVFWSQLTRLRSPLDNVIALGPQGKALADEFMRLTSVIRNALDSTDLDQHDRICHLNFELEKVVSQIRELPGLSRFLLPSLFCDLQIAARDGPVIIMNASKYGCDALIVFSDKDPVHIPLSVTKKDVKGLSLRLSTLRRRAKTMTMEEMRQGFMVFLRDLWDTLVSHIVDVLLTTCSQNSRIWWCPTAEFSLLPLHAATPYRQGKKGLSDIYVSSYTTTLTALIRARRAGSPDSAHEKPCFIAIGQAAAEGANELSAVGTEPDKIDGVVKGLATFRRIEGEECRIATVADELGKNDWVHFACHGVPRQKKPFESAFALRDGGFTVQHISQCDFQNPEFAYLSACHTTVGDKESPDEVIHLAAAMQFAGFRSIIGTMWAVDDSHTNKVISKFYEMMIDDSGRLDYSRAARALRFTMKKVDIPMDQRILYIHLGA